MSYDFILKRPRGADVSDREALFRALMKLPALSHTEIFCADPVDEEEAFEFVDDWREDGGDEEYRSFCVRHRFAEDGAAAALAFFEEQLGIQLATVHVPAESAVEPVLRELMEYARANRLVVEDPQRGIDLVQGL